MLSISSEATEKAVVRSANFRKWIYCAQLEAPFLPAESRPIFWNEFARTFPGFVGGPLTSDKLVKAALQHMAKVYGSASFEGLLGSEQNPIRIATSGYLYVGKELIESGDFDVVCQIYPFWFNPGYVVPYFDMIVLNDSVRNDVVQRLPGSVMSPHSEDIGHTVLRWQGTPEPIFVGFLNTYEINTWSFMDCTRI